MSEGFGRAWTAEVLKAAPMIAPVRQYVWPRQIAGEEDALARGALHVMVRPEGGGSFLVQCALGFSDPTMPSGVFGCPKATEMCAVAGGYAYVAEVGRAGAVMCADRAETGGAASLRAVKAGVLVFVGFQNLVAWGVDGLAWETGRLSWEGVTVSGWDARELRGMGWDLMADVEREFVVDLGTGGHTGGGWNKG